MQRFGDTYRARRLPSGLAHMTNGRLSVTVHMPRATKSQRDRDGNEVVNRLATYAPVLVHRVDDYPAALERWPSSNPENQLYSYFLEAKVGHMLWFNFNDAAQESGHHLAAIINAQNINAITGQKETGQPQMQQFVECPIHGHRFEDGRRFCPHCLNGKGREWPAQNYIDTTSTRPGLFWRDGFCTGGDYETREFLFTDQVERGVAANLIGAERVDAFGIALFESVESRPKTRRSGPSFSFGPPSDELMGYPEGFLGGPTYGSSGGSRRITKGSKKKIGSSGRRRKSIEVGAGALVDQKVGEDKNSLDFWQPEPKAIYILNFCGPEDFAEIRESYIDSQGAPEGFMDGLPVGNDD